MEDGIFRSIKAIIFSGLTFAAVLYLGFSTGSAALIAAIPLVLGMTNVMANVGFAVAVFAIVGAIGWYVMGPDQRAGVIAAIDEAKAEISVGRGAAETPAPPPADPAPATPAP